MMHVVSLVIIDSFSNECFLPHLLICLPDFVSLSYSLYLCKILRLQLVTKLLVSTADPMASAEQVPGNRVGPGMVVGTFNISEQGNGAFPDVNRVRL